MTLDSKFSSRDFPWFGMGMSGLFLFSILLRFWGLNRFNTLVFDEVYYAKFATAFLKGSQVFGGHPPLSTYLIAGGIWLANHFSLGDENLKNGLTGMLITPFSYRWLNALTGSFLPLAVAGIAYQLTYRRSYAFIAGLFAALDGLLLVESRYALNNIYLVLFGLLGNWFFLVALNAQPLKRWGWLAIAGIGFGASIAIKWNGLGFLLGAYLVWITAWIIRAAQVIRPMSFSSSQSQPCRSPLENLTQLHLGQILLGFALVPALTYRVIWIPFMQLDPATSFWGWQQKILDYHERVGGMDAHPYCSPWYSWPLMFRPVAYFYKTTSSVTEPAPAIGPQGPQDAAEIIYDVHAMGNPFLWWLSTAAIFLIVGLLAYQCWLWIIAVKGGTQSYRVETVSGFRVFNWTALYLVVNWAANWLPWIKVTRCVFLYHYMGSAVFALLAIAYIVHRWFNSSQNWHRTAAIGIILLILLAFIFWLPFYLGLPLSPEAMRIRRWFPSWI